MSNEARHGFLTAGRTKAGLERARAEGKQIGRLSKFERYKDQIQELKAESASKAEMKRQTGLAYNTVKRYLRRIDKGD